MQEKWYQKNWFVILMLLFVFPVGLFLMWYFKKWNKPARWIVTGVIVLAIIISPFMENKEFKSEEKEQMTANKEKKKEKTEKETTSKNNTKDKSKAKDNKKDNKTKNESEEKQNDNKEKEYVKTVKSYQSQIQIIGDDLVKLLNEIDEHNQVSEEGDVLLSSIKTQLETASNTINNVNLEMPKKYKQDHEDLLYADELINKGIKGVSNNDNEGLDNLEVGVSIADDAIKNVLEN